MDTSEALQSGFSVAEDVTVRYNDGSTQTESVLEVPNIAASTITTNKTKYTLALMHSPPARVDSVCQTPTLAPGRM